MGRGGGPPRMAAVAPATAALDGLLAVPGRPVVPQLVVTAARIEDVPDLRARTAAAASPGSVAPAK